MLAPSVPIHRVLSLPLRPSKPKSDHFTSCNTHKVTLSIQTVWDFSNYESHCQFLSVVTMWRGDKTCNLVNVTAHRRQPISSAALAATFLKVAGGNVRAEPPYLSSSKENCPVNHVLSEYKRRGNLSSGLNNEVITIYAGNCKWQTGQSRLQAALLAVPFILRKARDCLSQKHESQQVIIAGGGPIKMYHWDKKEINGWQALEDGWPPLCLCLPEDKKSS